MPKRHTKLIIIFSFISLIIFPSTSQSKDGNHKNYSANLQIINSKNKQVHEFKVKIVNKQSEMEKGLMFVTSLPQNHGMLFEFGKNEVIYMWMKNTKIPLDIIFIDKNNQIINIKHSAVPESLEIISSEKNANKVLEINGGLCQKLRINITDKIVVVSK